MTGMGPIYSPDQPWGSAPPPPCPMCWDGILGAWHHPFPHQDWVPGSWYLTPGLGLGGLAPSSPAPHAPWLTPMGLAAPHPNPCMLGLGSRELTASCVTPSPVHAGIGPQYTASACPCMLEFSTRSSSQGLVLPVSLQICQQRSTATTPNHQISRPVDSSTGWMMWCHRPGMACRQEVDHPWSKYLRRFF